MFKGLIFQRLIRILPNHLHPRLSQSESSRNLTKLHQEFQVPKMEGFRNLIAGYFWGVGETPLHKAYLEDHPS